MWHLKQKPDLPDVSGCEMVSSAEDTEVEEVKTPERREVTINEDASKITITRKIDRSSLPRSELNPSSPRRGEKEKNSSRSKSRDSPKENNGEKEKDDRRASDKSKTRKSSGDT